MSTLNSDRASEIQRIRQQRGISALVHFTHSQNLSSILQKGLLGRSILETQLHQQPPRYNDAHRLEGYREAVCLSISFPNYQMFYRYRQDNPQDWVVLLLRPSILWELDCAFCPENAASRNVTAIPIEVRKQPNSLQQLFLNYRNIDRESLRIPNQYPTHPQAEILVFERIDSKYIYQVHFYDSQSRQQWLKANESLYKPATYYGNQYFRPRCDYQSWNTQAQIISPVEADNPLF